MSKEKTSFFVRIKEIFIGRARNPLDKSVFQHMSLIAFFAWVGLGADGLSSSCYGPEETFLALGKHHFLGLIVALASAFTIFIIAESYSQIVELFPTGGGGYIVATELLSPTIGMVAGAALLIDYVLTITISIASGADALFSFLPAHLLQYKLIFALFALVVLIILNLRGVKESVVTLMPIFLTFIVTHAIIIIYALATHLMGLPAVIQSTAADINTSVSEVGVIGLFFLIMRAYSMGAGTYTGIEAVSNGLPILKEPKVETAKKTMKYMMISLASVVLGLMFAYTLYGVEPVFGKTLNAVLFEKVSGSWGIIGPAFLLITLFSEAAILFVAAQSGFLGGPPVLANMAADRWVPKRFSLLSDRLVTMNGVLILGVGAFLLMFFSKGAVSFLVVLYSINVFITFCLSQAGMVKHWISVRKTGKKHFYKLLINGIGLALTSFILISVSVIKFHEGGWITLFITGILILFMLFIKFNYTQIDRRINKLNAIVGDVESQQQVPQIPSIDKEKYPFDPKNKTAVLFVKDFTAVGLKTIFSIFESFGTDFKNFVFVQVGLIDAAAFKGTSEIDKVQKKVKSEVGRYVELLQRHGYYAEGMCLYGIDTVEEVSKVVPQILERFPNAKFFGGQIIFPKRAFISRLLHNYTLIAVQKDLYKNGIHLYLLPIEISKK